MRKFFFCQPIGEELTRDRQKALRKLEEVLVDVSPLVEQLSSRKNDIEALKIIKDAELCLKGRGRSGGFRFRPY